VLAPNTVGGLKWVKLSGPHNKSFFPFFLGFKQGAGFWVLVPNGSCVRIGQRVRFPLWWIHAPFPRPHKEFEIFFRFFALVEVGRCFVRCVPSHFDASVFTSR